MILLAAVFGLLALGLLIGAVVTKDDRREDLLLGCLIVVTAATISLIVGVL